VRYRPAYVHIILHVPWKFTNCSSYSALYYFRQRIVNCKRVNTNSHNNNNTWQCMYSVHSIWFQQVVLDVIMILFFVRLKAHYFAINDCCHGVSVTVTIWVTCIFIFAVCISAKSQEESLCQEILRKQDFLNETRLFDFCFPVTFTCVIKRSNRPRNVDP
jgi:hypothetical protein